MKTKLQYTVIKCGTKFWTGEAYLEEYPNAKTYTNWPSVKEIKKATSLAISLGLGNALSVYRNYGLAVADRYQFIDAVRNEGVIASEYTAVVSC